MIVTPADVKITLPESPTPRSAGIHVSGIIRAIAVEMGIIKPDNNDSDTSLIKSNNMSDIREITDPVALLRISIGLAWEAYYIPQILAKEGVAKHPGEMRVSGIYMSPDGESLDVIITPKGHRQHIRIHEVKATYKSVNTVADISKEWMWLTQIKAYCVAAQTRYAKLHVLFLCGDYKFPIRPELRCWDIEFTQKEIDDNWSLLVQYRDERQQKEKV